MQRDDGSLEQQQDKQYSQQGKDLTRLTEENLQLNDQAAATAPTKQSTKPKSKSGTAAK